MMTTEIKLLRNLKLFPGLATIGALTINEEPECVTLEDPVREVYSNGAKRWIWKEEFKLYGRTAIPSGRYPLVIDFSERFKRPMPHILNVPDYGGIRIHNGGTVLDTEGCPLTGREVRTGPDGMPYLTGSKQDAFPKFFLKLENALMLGYVFITISNGEPA